MELSIDGLYSGLIGMLLSGGTQAGGSVVNAARTNTSTPVSTASQADYTPYLEQLKQAQWNRKIRDLQSAYQKFLQSESGANQQHTQEEPLINSVNSKYDKVPDFDSVANQLIGIETSTGIKVDTISSHVVSRLTERGVSVEEAKDALTAPLKVGKIREDKSQQFVGERVTVVINTDTGKIITTWRTHTKRAAILKGK